MTALIKYEAACRALAECKAVDEVKSLVDKAAAMQAYGRMAKDRTLEIDASEIRIRAERRLGEMLAAQDLNKGGRPIIAETGRQSRPVPSAPTLSQAGISKDLSSRAQKLAAVPEAQFEAELAAKRERDREEGARVSARLEKVGAQALKAKSPADARSAQIGDDAHDGFDPLEELEKANAEIAKLQAELDATQADDLKAEALKWRRLAKVTEDKLGEKMDLVQKSFDREARIKRQLMRCGKAVGETDPDKIAPTVEAFVRTHTRKAA